MDNGRIKMETHNGILYCDVYIDDELSLSDLTVIREEIRRNFPSGADIICMNSGSYSVSIEFQKAAMSGIKEFRNVVYVAEGKTKRDSAEYAAATFMKAYNARVANSVEEAYDILTQDLPRLLANNS